MATFRPVNTSLVPETHGRTGDEASPLTPRPSTAPTAQAQQMMRDDATTPTRANFGTLASQRPLPPATTFPATISATTHEDTPKQPLNRGDSQYSAKSRDSDDVEMGDSDGEDGSDDDASVNADGTRSSKKKGKAQRFFCTEYPPCSLSFTRSEHLARHIRKHTGERPFQCHCSRRFSRLDNLRQHAQTVHQNEEIPQDSLAATGTRFQRQVRTDRVRPPGSRSRASISGSQPGQVRGHTRNSLSTSSIGSVSSAYSQRDDMRRRPAPLVMAGEPRQRFSQEIYGRPDSPSGQYPFRPHSPGGFSTPTSSTFSTGQNSPRWGSGMQSPISSHSRNNSTNIYGHRTPGRRLSVPSAHNPFQSPHGNSYGTPVLGQMPPSNVGFSPSSSMMSSPTTSTSGSTFSRRESVSSAADEAWRRRTWHPESHSPAFNSSFTSRLQQVTTPNYYSNGPPPQPPIVPSNAPPLEPPTRLPGIESFDPLPPKSTTPLHRQPSPMMIDNPSRAHIPRPADQYQERPGSQHWDQGINRNMNRLDLSQGTPPTDAAGSWAAEAHRAVQAQAEQTRALPGVRFEESPYSGRPRTSGGGYHQHHVSAPPAPITPREAKRMGWYNGPVSVATTNTAQPLQRTSPADSSSSEGGIPGTPSSSTVAEYNPGIVHASGWVENRNGTIPPQHDARAVQTNGYASYPPPNGVDPSYSYAPGATQGQTQHQQHIPKSSEDTLRLQALVAVATSQDSVAAAY